MTPQQYKRKIDEYNRKVNQHNAQLKRNIDNYNREVKRHNNEVNKEIKRVNDFNKKQIQTYNNQVRQYNNAQRLQRQQLQNALNKFNQSRNTLISNRTSVLYTESVRNLERNYEILDNYNQSHHLEDNSVLLQYPTKETSNSLELYNSLTGVDKGEVLNPNDLQRTVVEERLYDLSSELGKRWTGAIFSLNPGNPDAARHFCTSVREIFIQLFDIKAPDYEVLDHFPNCVMHQGKPARREKIKYILSSQSTNSSTQLVDFIEADVDDLLELFRTLNSGTHGSAGTFTVQQLLKLKKRAEDSITFITALGVE